MLTRSVPCVHLSQWHLYGSRRSLFKLPGLPSMSPFGAQSDTQKYHERKILPYSRKQLYDVVSDVASYSHFVPFCTGSRILRALTPEPGSSKKLTMDAELTVGFLSFKESYISKVTCVPGEFVGAIASSSALFETLSTIWRFQPASPQPSHPADTPFHLHREHFGPTLVTLDLAYAFASPIHAGVSAAFFSQLSPLMVKAFDERCQSLYGPGRR